MVMSLIYSWLACKKKSRRRVHLSLALAALSVAAISVLELLLMQTTDVLKYNVLLRWASLPIALMITSVTCCITGLADTGPRWLAGTAVFLNIASQVANFFSPQPAVRWASELRRQQTWWGTNFSVPKIESGFWVWVELLSVLLLIVFIITISSGLRGRDKKMRACMTCGGVVFFLLFSRGHAFLVEAGLMNSPYLVSFSFVSVLLIMGGGVARDVLSRDRLALALSESEQRIDLAARAVSLGFWSWDLVSNRIWMNDTTLALFGLDSNDAPDRSRLLQAIHPEDLATVRQAISASLSNGDEYECTYRVCLPDGSIRWIAARGRPERNHDGSKNYMRGVLTDVTAQRKSARELESVRTQLAHVGRVSLMGKMASSLAHELNQPLGAILRNTEAAEIIIESDSPDLGEIRAIIHDIKQDNVRAGQVMDRMRAMLKPGALDVQAIDLELLLKDALALIRREAKMRCISVQMQIDDPGLPKIHGDRVQLLQVLINLLLNSMDALDGNKLGSVKMLTLGVKRADSENAVELYVRDSGPGISADVLSQVFEPFFSTKPDGMGLGLSISVDIASAHGGMMSAESKPGEYALFRFTLPADLKKSPSQ
jgi:two-component system sensor kinase FixL